MKKDFDGLEVYMTMLEAAKMKRRERDSFEKHVRKAMLKGVDWRSFYDEMSRCEQQLQGMVEMITVASGVDESRVRDIVEAEFIS